MWYTVGVRVFARSSNAQPRSTPRLGVTPAMLHRVRFGTTSFLRDYCPDCKADALILSGRFLCCDQRPVSIVDQEQKLPAKRVRRKPPSLAIQRQLLREQNYKCRYCGVVLAEWVERQGGGRFTGLQWDHVVPYSRIHANPCDNWVAACKRCNGLKGSKVFDPIEDVKGYVYGKGQVPATTVSESRLSGAVS